MLETLDLECLQHSEGFNASLCYRTSLSQLSPKDKKWDDRRAESDLVRDLYQKAGYDRLAQRIDDCSKLLEMDLILLATGNYKLLLQNARFCRVRNCPVCQWRRSLMWRAKAFKALPRVIEAYPSYRFIFLTLTIKNCQIGSLRATIGQMNKGWARLTKLKAWIAVGWIKSLEVTRSADDQAHPHFHCLLMVPPGYFAGKNYLSQQAWAELWQKSMKLPYLPIVDVRVVKPKKDSEQNMFEAICETLQYTVKTKDLIGNAKKEITDKDVQWIAEITTQLHKTRAIATGGILKEYFKELEEEPEDLIHTDNDEEEEKDETLGRVNFDWESPVKKYLQSRDNF